MKEFFIGIWNSLTSWFIEGRGWATLLGIVGTVVIGLIIVKIILRAFKALLDKTKVNHLASNFILTIVRVVLYIVYIMAVMKCLGVDTSGVLAILASCSIAFSLALQSTLSNFSSGMILVSNKPFAEGDFVDAAGVSGTVEKITLSSTKIRTPDNKVVTVPNSAIANGNIVNYSTADKRRVDLVFGAGYGSDVEKVKQVITKELEKHSLILHDEGYTVRLTEQGASSINFVCRCWVKTADYWTVYFDLTENMYDRFNEEGIEIPYNKLDVNIINKD